MALSLVFYIFQYFISFGISYPFGIFVPFGFGLSFVWISLVLIWFVQFGFALFNWVNFNFGLVGLVFWYYAIIWYSVTFGILYPFGIFCLLVLV